VTVRLPEGVRSGQVRSLVSAVPIHRSSAEGLVSFSIPSISDHEVLVIE
jgi:hypothetical protein